MKKIFTLFLALAASVGSIFAEEVYVNGFRYEINAPTATLINNGSQYSGDVIIPRTIRYNGKEYLVNAIGNAAFYNSTRLTSVIIPNSVVSIGSSVFMNCISLTSVTIPKSVTRIGTGAFYECHSLDSVHIDDIAAWCKINFEKTYWSNPLYLGGANLYLNGELVTDVIIPHDIKSIGDYIFYNYSSLRSVTIPNSVTSSGEQAFYGCSSLDTVHISDISAWCKINFTDETSNPITNAHNLYLNGELVTDLVIPDNVNSIGDYAFCDCSSLISVTVPNSVTSIGDSAFCDCSSLTSVTVPNSVTTIGDYAFCGCSSLTSMTVPNSVTSIGDYAFCDCSSLTSVTVPNSVTTIGYCSFNACRSLTNLTIPNSVKDIDGYAFGGCTGLTSVIIPDNVAYIGKSAFAGCSNLATITIGNGVKQIWDHAFSDCSSLAYVICKATKIPSTATDAFDLSIPINALPSATLYVPKASLDKYKSTSPWSRFKQILPIEDSSEDPSNPDNGEDDGTITCAEAVAICQETGTTITTEEYTIRGYVTEIKSAYSEQYNNITFWMADTPHGGRVLQAYRVIPVEANDIDVKVGDYVEVIGSLVNYYGTTPEVYTGGIYTILPKQEENGSTTEEEYITACDSYEWHGETYTESGDYTYTTTTENGCEHVEILHLTIYKSEYVETSITACDSYEWHGETYTESGDYTYTTTTENGCERVEILHLMITPSDSGSDNEIVITCEEAVSICQQTGTTATTNEYTIQGYVTKIKAAYSEQHDNITFWMADISPTQMDNSSNSVTSLSDYPNIALGKSTTASSSEDSGTLPEYINDGDFNTRWSSEWQDNEYITIDLEQYSFIDHITLHWETAYASQFAILITDEQPSSSALSSPLPSSATCYQSSGDVQTIPAAKSGRYITLIGIERATAYGISLYELEAYGMPLLQAYRVKPIQSTDKYVQIGDYVEAVGTLVNYGGTTPEINAGGTYTILTKHEENGSTTSVENTNTQSSMTNCQKILYEDHIYILREDKIYNAMGQEL